MKPARHKGFDPPDPIDDASPEDFTQSMTFVPVEHCDPCGVAIYKLAHERTGNRAPIEVATSERGNIAINLTRGTYSIVGKAQRAEHAGFLHLNHYVTCPAAELWHNAGRSESA